MSKSKRYFEQEEELLQEVIEQGIQFNDLDPEDEEEFSLKEIIKNKGEHL